MNIDALNSIEETLDAAEVEGGNLTEEQQTLLKGVVSAADNTLMMIRGLQPDI